MPKTTFKVRQKRWAFFNRECDALLIKRDAFISRVIEVELTLLKDISPCDDIGAKWLKENWILRTYLDRPDTEMESVAIALSKEVINSLNSVCEDKQIPRDAFFNLMLEFLSLRILDAAWTIKELRGNRDFIGQMSELLKEANATLLEDDTGYERTIAEWRNDLAKDFCEQKQKLLQLLEEDNFYHRLTFTKVKVEEFLDFFEDGL